MFKLDELLRDLMSLNTVDDLATYSTKNLKAKLADLWREISKPENAGNRSQLIEIHHSISALSSDRNICFHGLWGYTWCPASESWKEISQGYAREEPFFSDSLTELHNKMILSSKLLADAKWRKEVGNDPPETRNRRQIWGHRPPIESDPHPPERKIR
ncbi:MAG: hypothetical protein V7676_18215 [Parasphingorhabdus sp.]|nr:hypothetical protein [Sphingorhabdus sp. YGSMI21]